MAAGTLHIDLDAVVANWRMMQARAAPARASAVVKADAYGLGARQAGTALARAGCNTFYVAWPQEGADLRQAIGPGPTILVFHGPTPDSLILLRGLQLTPVLNSLDQIALWNGSGGGPAALHLDTGMNRLGAPEAQWAEAARLLPAPIMLISHLACGDEDSPANARQLARFQQASQLWPGIPRSLAASGGTYLGRDFHFDEIRPGIALYGGGPAPAEGPSPQAVVTITAPALQVRETKAGETVGYGCTWTAKSDCRLATLGIGYADGFLRSASNRGQAFVRGQRRPIVGRISMDLTVIDITGLSVAPGDDIELIGPNIPLSEAAEAMGTIDYEILTRLGARLNRRYSGGK